MVFRRFFFSLLGFLVFGCVDKDQQDYNTAYFRNFNYNFSGIVSQKHYIGNSKSLGMLLLENVDSVSGANYSIDSLDYFYYASIKTKGVLIENKLYEIEIGDSLAYNSKDQLLRVFRADSLVLTEKPVINTHIFAKPNKEIIKEWLFEARE